MRDHWQKPDFVEIAVGGECTAYSGAVTDWEGHGRAVRASVRNADGSIVPVPSVAGEPARRDAAASL